MPSEREMPVLAAVYVMESGIRGKTVELAPTLPGDYLPLEGSGVTDQQETVAGLSGHSLLTAIPLIATLAF